MTVAVVRRGLQVGDLFPWLRLPMLGGEADFRLDRVGGDHILMLAIGSATAIELAPAIETLRARAHTFRPGAVLFVVGNDIAASGVPGALGERRGCYYFSDPQRVAGVAIGVLDSAGEQPEQSTWLLLGPGLRVAGRFPVDRAEAAIDALAAAADAPAVDMTAPVLVIPDVFEPGFCRYLIDLYEADGGEESGFMREIDGRTVGMHDPKKKRRRDYQIEDTSTRNALRARVNRRIAPMIERAFQFKVTRIERYIVACYAAADGGHFASHRDNTTPATAHRRFAVTINLNGDYDGGDLSFPEFGLRTYRAPPGGAVVFSCSLLHEAGKVTAGKRYATLPFLYDDRGAQQRSATRDTIVAADKFVFPAAG
jgi:predicted 2-oxoglutarate/Fe(II)-dependent dioxygenase YbiX